MKKIPLILSIVFMTFIQSVGYARVGGIGDSEGQGIGCPGIGQPGVSCLPPPLTVGTEIDLKDFIRAQVREARRAGEMDVVILEAQAHGQREGFNDDEMRAALGSYFKDSAKNEEKIVEALTEHVMRLTSNEARIYYASAIEALQPVLEYYKTNYGEDLSNVVVVVAPISSIPISKGEEGQGGRSIGLFLPPAAIQLEKNFSLPLNKIDALAKQDSYVSGVFEVKLANQVKMHRAAMEHFFHSERLIHIDLTAAGSLFWQSTAAHEFRHLIDYFNCPNSRHPELCDPAEIEKNWNETVRNANDAMEANYKAYLHHPLTLQARKELEALIRKYQPMQDDAERERWVQDELLDEFDQIYQTYPKFFSNMERRAYKEQLKYLLSRGLTRQEAIQTVIVTKKSVLQMDGKEEYVTCPGLPWVEELFGHLIDEPST
jgi:hypothetical protein